MLLRFIQTAAVCVFGFLVGANSADALTNTARQTISLNGDWLFQRDGAKADDWKRVQVPSSFEQHEGPEFNGIGWYRKEVQPFTMAPGQRVLLHFEAAATEAEVWWNGTKLGSHLGGWTPFRFDVTEEIRKAPAGKAHEIRVRLDEKVGHNTQGFLPIIAPHFGGIWQDVALLIVPETFIDDLKVLAIGDSDTSELRLEIPSVGPVQVPEITVKSRLRETSEWTALQLRRGGTNNPHEFRASVPDARLWSPAEPNLYELEITLSTGDQIRTRAAFRKFEVFGQQFRLNGHPLQIRGLLNWGYSAPLTAPNPGEEVWRHEFEFARARGFNLMKFCLWFPPRRCVELADELGMLTWMEYPTWHPNLTAKYLTALRQEFLEFFHADRNHTSIILRSLTCETGSGAQLSVIQSLYDLVKTNIPGAIVEDDSSWIGWNRVHDFYDDHPYGNNHTWLKTLSGFNEYILGHGLKPLVLGEAIAADTYVNREAVLAKVGDARPWHAPGPLDELPQWEKRMESINGQGGLKDLRGDSLHYGMLMRKFQVEAYRREIPYGGYVISVIRDIPNASMGLIDYTGAPKWPETDWAWQRDTMCLLKTQDDARSFEAGQPLRGELLLSHFGQARLTGQLLLTLENMDTGAVLQRRELKDVRQNSGTLATLLQLNWALPETAAPMHFKIKTRLKTPEQEFANEWPVWVVPKANVPAMRLHRSVGPELARELFPGATPMAGDDTARVVVASVFDDELTRLLGKGGRVLLLPNGGKNSFPLNSHWFLRGAPYIPSHALSGKVPRQLLLELQHFDLASQVVPDLQYLEQIDPMLMLWDTHDLKTIKTHGLIFETRAGQGRLLVSAVRHAGTNNAAGRWLLATLIEHLSSSPAPNHGFSDELWAHLKNKLHAEITNLVSVPWQFKPDPKNEGLGLGWHKPVLASTNDWKPIRIGAAWESQGYQSLDGWAWYRLAVDIPERWQGREVYLSFEGVDDIYELYVNGELAARGGDLATRKDTFNERKSQNITRFVKPGQKAVIAIRVHDWYGAGGIFRPVTLGTVGFNPSADVLK